MAVYNMSWFRSLEQVRQAVQDGDGLLATEAEHVMAACGWERWTSNTGGQIVRHLRKNGLEVFGDEPASRTDPIRIFIPGSDIGRIVDAVTHPDLTGDEELRSRVRGDAGILDQIRSLLSLPAGQ